MKKLIQKLILLPSLFIWAVSASAQVSFAPATSVGVGSGPVSVFVADVNLDGKPDFLTANFDDDNVSVRLGDGLGGFSGTTNISVGSGPVSVFVADVNLDGKPDLLTANNLSDNVSVRLGDGAGNFTGTTEINVGQVPSSIFVADVNLDGKPDLLAASLIDNNVSVRLGDGLGGFSGTTNISVGSVPQSVFVADVNLDGKPDLLAASLIDNNVSVRLGDGLGGFSGTTNISVGSGPVSVFVADVNLDGKPDLLTANNLSDNVSVRLGDGLGGFSGTTNISVGTNPQSVFVADVNLDGKPDFLTANSNDNNVSVRLGDGAGNFTGTTEINVGQVPSSIFVADVDLDGKPDFLTANFDDNNVSVALNNTPVTIGSLSLTALISVSNSPNDVFVADVNLDGKPDFLAATSGNNVSVRLGDGAGNFTGTTNIPVGSNPQSVFVADVNLDGKPDLLTANFHSNTVSVRLGDGLGGFSGSTNISVGTNPQSVFVADVNLDGKPDLLTANSNDNNVSVRLGDGAGNFTGTTDISVGSGPLSVFVADVNLDGKPDLLAANFDNDNVSVRLGDGAGNFTGSTNIPVGSGPVSVFVADVNLDGKPDLLVLNETSYNVSVRLGDGAGNFTGTTDISVGSNPNDTRDIFVADVNLDGKPDLLTANTTMNTVSVRLGDGAGNFTGTTEINVGRGPSSIFVADVNLDGKPDILTGNESANSVSVVLSNLPDYTGPVSGITPGNYSNVTFTAGGALSGNVTLGGTLTLNDGVEADLNGQTLAVKNANSSAVVGTGFLTGNGSFIREFNGNFAYTFPYRASGNDRSATVTFTSGAISGNLTFSFFNTPPGNAGLPQTFVGQVVNVVAPFYWRINATLPSLPPIYTLTLRGENTPGVTNVTTLRIAKRPNASSWSNVNAGTGTANTGTTANPTVVQSGISGFSEFSIGGAGGGDNPLPVELIAFTLTPKTRGILVQWETASETDNLGFILSRSLMRDGPFEEVASYLTNSALRGLGTSLTGKTYSYLDNSTLQAGRTYFYKLSDVDLNGNITEQTIREITLPHDYSLSQNYPNPFNPTTTIEFSLRQDGHTTLEVFNVLGERVAVLVDGALKAGVYQYPFNATHLASGMYFYRLRSNEFMDTKKMMLVK